MAYAQRFRLCPEAAFSSAAPRLHSNRIALDSFDSSLAHLPVTRCLKREAMITVEALQIHLNPYTDTSRQKIAFVRRSVASCSTIFCPLRRLYAAAAAADGKLLFHANKLGPCVFEWRCVVEGDNKYISSRRKNRSGTGAEETDSKVVGKIEALKLL